MRAIFAACIFSASVSMNWAYSGSAPEETAKAITLPGYVIPSPKFFIDAARHQPDKSMEIIQAAYAEYQRDQYSPFIADLGVELWQSSGEAKTTFLVDKFYDQSLVFKETNNDWRASFIDRVGKIHNPSGKKLIAVILRDKRAEKPFGNGLAFLALISQVNILFKQDIVSSAEWTHWMYSEQPQTAELEKELLQKMRASIPLWIDS